MRFSPRLTRTVTTSILTIALFGPFLGTASAADDHRAHPNPLRPDSPDETIWEGLASERVGSAKDSLKAGTLIPATEGRIVHDGDNWVFVADYPEFASIILPEKMRRIRPANAFRVATSIAKVADAKLLSRNSSFFGIQPEYYTPNQIPENKFRSNKDETPRFAFDNQTREGFQSQFPTKMVIAKNLMLERITSQLTFANTSEQLIVSGLITLEQGRPQLQLHRADLASEPFPFPAP